MKKIGIFTHKGCDLDALCSTESMAKLIEENYPNLEVIAIIQDSFLREKLKGNRQFISLEEARNIQLDYALVCDVNEYDRVYGIELIEKVPIENRYQIDHHDGNRVVLEIPDKNKIIHPKAAATCQIITEKLTEKQMPISKDMAYNLYLGIASDTSGFKYGVTEQTIEMVEKLPLTEEEKEKALKNMTELTEQQKDLLEKIKEEEVQTEGLKIYKLLEPIESGDITPLVNANQFQERIAATEENPVSCFIIGIGNNYFIKLRKLPECDIDIVSIATKCNGGGHETRCAGRFYNDSYENVLATIISEYEQERGKASSSIPQQKGKHIGEVNPQ